MTNVSRRDSAVNGSAPGSAAPPARPEAIEITGLLAQIIRTGYVGRSGRGGTARPGEVAGSADGPGGDAAAAGAATGGEVDVSPHMVRAAIHIHEHGPLTIGQLARGLGTSQGWTSRIVDDLERAGYVERMRDPDDRRVVRVGLTPMASERVERAARWRGDAVETALAGMSADERAAVVTFLRRFAEGSGRG